MKTLVAIIALTLTSLFVFAQNNQKLTVNITQLKNDNGKVIIVLRDANDKEIAAKSVAITNKTCTVVFDNLPKGKYAIKYYHDENNNGQLDRGMFGKPIEGYGYSNDARGFMGPADFEDQVFSLNGDLRITLKTKN